MIEDTLDFEQRCSLADEEYESKRNEIVEKYKKRGLLPEGKDFEYECELWLDRIARTHFYGFNYRKIFKQKELDKYALDEYREDILKFGRITTKVEIQKRVKRNVYERIYTLVEANQGVFEYNKNTKSRWFSFKDEKNRDSFQQAFMQLVKDKGLLPAEIQKAEEERKSLDEYIMRNKKEIQAWLKQQGLEKRVKKIGVEINLIRRAYRSGYPKIAGMTREEAGTYLLGHASGKYAGTFTTSNFKNCLYYEKWLHDVYEKQNEHDTSLPEINEVVEQQILIADDANVIPLSISATNTDNTTKNNDAVSATEPVAEEEPAIKEETVVHRKENKQSKKNRKKIILRVKTKEELEQQAVKQVVVQEEPRAKEEPLTPTENEENTLEQKEKVSWWKRFYNKIFGKK